MKIQPYLTLLSFPLLTPFLALTAGAQNAKPPLKAPADKAVADQLRPPALLAKNPKTKTSSPLKVESLDVQVTVTGNTAETTMTMTFKNDTDRILEGELVFPLSEGMTVSNYALEVNGAMRQGVIVEKQRARAVYESIVRKQIDPGLVEWTKGNNFRTRIYPIPAKGTKTVSISYEETLLSDGKQLSYQLPLAFKEKLGDFKLNINVIRPGGKPQVIVADNGGLKLQQNDAKQWNLSAHEKDFAANQALKLAIPSEDIAKQLVHKASDGSTYFYLVDNVAPKQKIVKRPTPKSLTLIWDASNSGAKRDHEKEIALLVDYIKQSKVQSIQLQLLRNTLEEAQTISLKKGTKQLEEILSDIRYDGATRLGALDFRKIKSDATLLVSDGISTLGQSRPETSDKPVFIFHASQSAEHSLLKFLGAKSGGAYVNLKRLNQQQGLAALTTQQFSLLSVQGDGIKDVYPSVATPVVNQTSISGKVVGDKPVTLTLNYGVAGKVMHTSKVKLNPNQVSADATNVPRLWAQKKLSELDAEAEKYREEIIDLAQTHGIVTRFTSLLVLDRMDDYVRHRIAPPEPALRKEYEKRIKGMPDPDAPDPAHFARIINDWKSMVKWHQGSYETAGSLLVKYTTRHDKALERLKTDLNKTLKSKTATEEQITEAKKKLTTLEKVIVLQKQAIIWKDKNGSIHAGPDAAYKKMLEDYRKLASVLIAAPPVKKAKAEVLERNGAAPAVPLAAPAAGAADYPFGDAGGGIGGGGAPFGRDVELARPTLEGGRIGFFGSKMKDEEKGQRQAGATLAKWDPKTPYLIALREAAKENKDIETLYFEWKKKNENSSAFFLDVADFFFQQEKPKVAMRILSNVAELDMENPALLRILGHRYDQLGKHDLAEMIFREVLSLRDDEPQSHRDLALVLEKQGKFQEAADALWHVALNSWDRRLEGIQLIALTELNAMIAKHKDKINTQAYNSEVIYNLDADVRIILTWDADNTDIDLWVTGPLGEKCYYSHNSTKTGGHMSRDFTQGYGPEVFMIKNAINGDYTIKANYYGNSQQKLAGETTIQATLVTNWGRKNEKRQAITLRLKNKKEVVDIGKLTFKAKK